MSLTVEMVEILDRGGAQLAHPGKAYILHHLKTPQPYDGLTHEQFKNLRIYLRSLDDREVDPEITDYLLRLHLSVEALFGVVGFDTHLTRTYPVEGLKFHQDHYDVEEYLDDEEVSEPIRMVTCIHNVASDGRTLTFRKPTWTGHHESFSLTIPPAAILAFGDSLITDYEHGIPASPEVAGYQSVVTRFALWADPDD